MKREMSYEKCDVRLYIFVVFDRNCAETVPKECVSAEKSLPKLTPTLFLLEHYFLGLSLNDRTIPFLVVLLYKTVSVE